MYLCSVWTFPINVGENQFVIQTDTRTHTVHSYLAIWLGRLQFSNFWCFCHCHKMAIESNSNAPTPLCIWKHIALSLSHVWKQSIGKNKDLNNSAARNNNWFFFLLGRMPRLWHSRHYAVLVSCDCIRWYSEHVRQNRFNVNAICVDVCMNVNVFYCNWLDGVRWIRLVHVASAWSNRKCTPHIG